MEALGKKIWAIGDGYMSSTENGAYNSHESICVLNTSDKCANVNITIYFEDRAPLEGFAAQCPAKRCNHIRLD